MKISPFTPLHFPEAANGSDGLPSRYLQTWATTDTILIELLASGTDTMPTGTLNDAHTGAALSVIAFSDWSMNASERLWFAELSGLSAGHYTVTVNGATCDEFRVTDDATALAKTTLIQYRFRDNRQRDDVVSVINGVPYYFSWRAPGGFKDGGWQFGVSNEQFTTQREDIVELYANDYTLKTFTLGGSFGVPVWCAELLNRLLTCSYVFFDGHRYTRSDSETPQINTLVEGLDSFVFTQLLRKAQRIDPTFEPPVRAPLRMVGDLDAKIYRGVYDSEEEENINRLIK